MEKDWQGVALKQLVQSHLAPFLVSASQLEVAGPELLLTPSAAQHLGLALHELATNAIKYGALSIRAGRVRLLWAVEGEDEDATLRVRWSEHAGPRVSPPAAPGFGCLVLQRVAPQSLEGQSTLQFARNGLTWDMSCPADNALVSPLP